MQETTKFITCVALVLSIIMTSPFGFIISGAADSSDNTVVFTKENIKKEDMRKKSDITQEDLESYLKKFPYLSGISETLIQVQDEYNVNAMLLLAIIRLESGNGKSNIARAKNNLGGLVGLYRSKAVYKHFDSKDDCIVFMAELLSNHYLTEGGKYFSGYTLPDIAKRYSSSKAWTDLVYQLIYEIQYGLNNIA